MKSGDLLYVIGIPGAGKTELLARILRDVPGAAHSSPFAHVGYPGGVWLGVWRGPMSGTDALPMNAQPAVLRWLSEFPSAIVLGEGDRLGNARFFEAVKAQGWRLTVVLLDTPLELAAARRTERGSTQSLTWLKGRFTKIHNLRPYVDPAWVLDGRQPVEVLAEWLLEHPVMQRLIHG